MLRTILAIVCLAAAAPAFALEPARTEIREIGWRDLLPEGEEQRIARLREQQAQATGLDHFGVDRMPQIETFNTVDELDGQPVRLAGFVLPFDYAGGGEVTRFLLVPYVGACIHVPPPPPNQLVYVETSEPVRVEGLYEPVYAQGVLHARRTDNDLGDAAYALQLSALTPYQQ